MGRQSILHLRFNSRKVDINRSLNLYFVCPDGKIRLFMTRSNSTMERLIQELADRMKMPANDLNIMYRGHVIKQRTKDGELTTPLFFKMHDNDVIKIVIASQSPAA